MCDGKMEWDMEWVVMPALYWTVVTKKELSHKVKLSINRFVDVPTLTSNEQGHGYKWLKQAFSRYWTGFALEIGWGAQTARGSSEYSRWSLVLKGANWDGLGI